MILGLYRGYVGSSCGYVRDILGSRLFSPSGTLTLGTETPAFKCLVNDKVLHNLQVCHPFKLLLLSASPTPTSLMMMTTVLLLLIIGQLAATVPMMLCQGSDPDLLEEASFCEGTGCRAEEMGVIRELA